MTYTLIGAGLRRYTGLIAKAEQAADAFTALPSDVDPGHVLAAFKRASMHIGASGRVVQLIDLLFAWTRPQDWAAGNAPIVWPSNELLSESLGVSVRQVQNILSAAASAGLLAHRDSPNGHRGGLRRSDGTIAWAYGLDLSPLGSRLQEFAAVAERAAEETRKRHALRRRLTIARKSIFQIAQTACEQQLRGFDWEVSVDRARQIAQDARTISSIDTLTNLVELIEDERSSAYGAFLSASAIVPRAALDAQFSAEAGPTLASRQAEQPVNHSCSPARGCVDSTTTMDLQPANAGPRIRLGSRRSRTAEPLDQHITQVEADLDRHRIEVAFIGRVCSGVTWQLEYGRHTWGELVALAESLTGQNAIPLHAWRDACRVMGNRGAAAAVIATIHKHRTGEVRTPGAYLRGMTIKATTGDLQLGRTFRGFQDAVIA